MHTAASADTCYLLACGCCVQLMLLLTELYAARVAPYTIANRDLSIGGCQYYKLTVT
jgi:hypothetical protein